MGASHVPPSSTLIHPVVPRFESLSQVLRTTGLVAGGASSPSSPAAARSPGPRPVPGSPPSVLASPGWSQWTYTSQERYSTLKYSTVQYSTVQYSTVQYNTVQYSTVQYSTVQYSTVQYSTVQYSTQQYIAVHSNTVQYSTVQYIAVQYSTVQYIAVQYNYSTVHSSTAHHNLQQGDPRDGSFFFSLRSGPMGDAP